MSDFNSQHNRAVWFDIPVSDLDRAKTFYSSVLAISVSIETFDGFSFGILEHQTGNGGCLIPGKGKISSTHGILVYLNVEGRIQDAVAKVLLNGGTIQEPVHAIGLHGFRAIICDSEGNKLALHSTIDS